MKKKRFQHNSDSCYPDVEVTVSSGDLWPIGEILKRVIVEIRPVAEIWRPSIIEKYVPSKEGLWTVLTSHEDPDTQPCLIYRKLNSS